MKPLPDQWLVVTAPAGSPAEALLLVDALRRVGARSVEREGERVVALFPAPDRPEALVAEAAAAIRASTSLPEPRLSWEWYGHDEWAAGWREAHPPERVTERLVVAPTGSRWVGERGDLVVRLDPAVAFGTAEHPTTRACLRLLESSLSPGDRVLDVGAGSGILSIAAALLGASRVLAIEADALACAAARVNAAASGAAAAVDVLERRVTPRDFGRLGRATGWARRGPFDAALANLDADTAVALLPGLASVLAAGGWLVLSGIVRVERGPVLSAAADAGLTPDLEELERGWWTARFRASSDRQRPASGARS